MIDALFENHGSVWLIRPLTELGRDWLDDHVQAESWQWLGDALSLAPRAVEAIADAMAEDGLEVSV
jgi:hypothetical protein